MKSICFKRSISAMLCLMLCVSIFAGCGQTTAPQSSDPNAESSSAAPAANDNKNKLVMWTWATGQFATVNETYFSAHDVDYELEEVIVDANDYLTKLQQGYAAGGDMPDILMSEIAWRSSAFQLGIWEDLEQEPYNLDRSLIYDFAVGTTVDNNGKVVGLENGVNSAFMSYKRDLAKEYLGTDVKEELEAMFTSYEDYATIGKQVYEKSGGKVTLFPGLQDVATMMLSQKRDISNVNSAGEIDISGKITPILSTLEKLRNAGACGNLTQWSSQWYTSFGQSNSILFPTAAWGITYLLEPNDPNGAGNWGMFTPAEGGYGWGGTCYGIYKDSEMKQEAWDFISWVLLSKEGAQVFKEANSLFLPVKSLFEDPAYTEGVHPLFGDQQIYKFMMVDIAETIPAPKLTIYDNLINDSVNMVVQVMTADSSVTAETAYAQFMEDLQAKIPGVTIK